MILQGVTSVLLSVIFIIFACYNNFIFLQELKDEHAPSVVPVFGGLAGAVAVWIWPYHELRLWAFAPLLLDYGCGPYLVFAIFQEVRRAWRYRLTNLLETLAGESDQKRVEIKFYKDGRLMIEETFKNPTQFGSFSSSGTWRDLESGKGYSLRIWGAVISIEEQGGQWTVARETGWFRDELRVAPIVLSSLAPNQVLRRT